MSSNSSMSLIWAVFSNDGLVYFICVFVSCVHTDCESSVRKHNPPTLVPFWVYENTIYSNYCCATLDNWPVLVINHCNQVSRESIAINLFFSIKSFLWMFPCTNKKRWGCLIVWNAFLGVPFCSRKVAWNMFVTFVKWYELTEVISRIECTLHKTID